MSEMNKQERRRYLIGRMAQLIVIALFLFWMGYQFYLFELASQRHCEEEYGPNATFTGERISDADGKKPVCETDDGLQTIEKNEQAPMNYNTFTKYIRYIGFSLD
ncbi:hypothetical protein [Haloarcula salinisoli]|uniref:Uncharacterized protein n=1 Tax=Haloarcula salinisoli TaxID=2487746 RepID=A0A8J7YHQ2_9EURY|nr:hypothetical protein [Halomicroarcula salinisoli]MBX0288576.1 hypothetical protein [Halomicroarcula salinisoli]MBX0305752.1 hypothetical protein [Halomicroarcula salinisoli]